jgi:hypothetical protein
MSSNANQVMGDIDNLTDSFDFTRPHPSVPGGSIGKAGLDMISQRFQDRNRQQEGPGGKAWAENKDWAKKNKNKAGKPVGVYKGPGHMLSAMHIDGERKVEPQHAEMIYGVAGDTEARRKLEWFSNGSKKIYPGTEPSGAKNQASRPVYELDDSDKMAIKDFVNTTFSAVVATH